MRNNDYNLCFVERLTAPSWLFYVMPYLIGQLFGNRKTRYKIYFIDSSNLGILIANLTKWLTQSKLERLLFRLTDIRDDSGNLIWLRISYNDLFELRNDIISSPVFQSTLKDDAIHHNRLPAYLKKQTATIKLTETSAGRSFFLIHLTKWKATYEAMDGAECILFIQKVLWLPELKRYAKKYHVQVISMNTMQFNLKTLLLSWLGPARFKLWLNIYRIACHKGAVYAMKQLIDARERSHASKRKNNDKKISTVNPKIAVEYYGHLNLDHPQLHSDLFFWQQSPLLGEDILLTFGIPRASLARKEWEEISKHNIDTIALNPKATTHSSTTVFNHWPPKKGPVAFSNNTRRLLSRTSEGKWLIKEVSWYNQEFNYWSDFFLQNDVKIYTSWFKYDAAHYIIADALQSLGGITTIYQRAFDELPSAETTISSDIVFGFSKECFEIERRSQSSIPYHVVVGYSGDHRFSFTRGRAKEIRNQLKQHGAEHILAFFDENTSSDSRWHIGHEFTRENYAFLLEKVLSDSGIGLVIKPKVSSTLRNRLGEVAELLKEAEKTGRCFVFERGVLHDSYPPVVAALAADITIHGHLCAATAGIESALVGVPTLLLDREGWPMSKLYKLGRGRVVFQSWDELWNACKEHWNSKEGINGFGDWSSMLDEIDPFRDGRAAERIGSYLKWLLDGFKANLSRETVLSDAAQRYANIWGKDKIGSVNTN